MQVDENVLLVDNPRMCLSVPGEIISIIGNDELLRIGKVSFGGITKEISLVYVPQAKIGDYVLVHVGFALSIIDEQEARFVVESLNQLLNKT